MIRAGFLDAEAKRDLTELARDGSVEHRLGRRANALLLLNNGMSCVDVAKVLFIAGIDGQLAAVRKEMAAE